MGGCYGWMLIGACNPMLCPMHACQVFIYAISDEIVSVLRSFGIILGIPTSVVGLTVVRTRPSTRPRVPRPPNNIR